ncbi:phytoene desaturase family protein [Streptomyces radicis]|uniref:NAD(P)/FAD-dependent oxidoreductase n=1 Tax=Streptomyces radicis TaxID=1750517 RepID=A0A3A9WT24_9ACTN|nr:NAD(P)/FAD-dependent oxidoreductase [Streptomyces radicis]RKN10926.1 NAD(P)/FAD-dependent oxidoreductase [Streptomyces radicis]RKN25189.1 NAD(P)/FAD-dependent oxidoreductase [Streptomyces radicis]
MSTVDAAVVGSGPNGLAAAVTLARAGLRVAVHEAADTLGGGLRGAALFDPDIHHDVCAAVHPMAAASRFFRAFDLATRDVELLHAPIAYAHPLDGGPAALAHRELDATAAELGADGQRWQRLMAPLVARTTEVTDLLLSGMRRPTGLRAAPALLPRVLRHGTPWATGAFRGERAPALLAGAAAHAVGPLPSLPGAAIGLLMAHLAHTTGWPLPRGGSRRVAEAMADDIRAHGGTLHTGHAITDLRELSEARAVLLDVSPTALLAMGGDALPRRYARALARYRYGPAAGKADFLVSEPIPWADPAVGRAGTVHLGGPAPAIHRQETANARGLATGTPFVLVVDPAVTDPSRARPGRRPVWAYAHLPPGDERDPLPLVRAAIERYAPGFTDTILAQRGVSGAELARYNANYVGGDIGTGAVTLRQSVLRPAARVDPYRTPLPGVYLCSAATPPGPGVHGMCGLLAARSALRREFGLPLPALGPDRTAVTP